MADERWVPRCSVCQTANLVLGVRYAPPHSETPATEYGVYCPNCGTTVRLSAVLWVRL